MECVVLAVNEVLVHNIKYEEGLLVLGVMLEVLVLVGGCLWFFVLRERVVLEGWIDCMPPLTEHK